MYGVFNMRLDSNIESKSSNNTYFKIIELLFYDFRLMLQQDLFNIREN